MSLQKLVEVALEREHSTLANEVYQAQQEQIDAFQKQRSRCLKNATSAIILDLARQPVHEGTMSWDRFERIAFSAQDCVKYENIKNTDMSKLMASVAFSMGPKFSYTEHSSRFEWKIEK